MSFPFFYPFSQNVVFTMKDACNCYGVALVWLIHNKAMSILSSLRFSLHIFPSWNPNSEHTIWFSIQLYRIFFIIFDFIHIFFFFGFWLHGIHRNLIMYNVYFYISTKPKLVYWLEYFFILLIHHISMLVCCIHFSYSFHFNIDRFIFVEWNSVWVFICQ